MNGFDFWSNAHGEQSCEILHREFVTVESNGATATVLTRNDWVASGKKQGEVIIPIDYSAFFQGLKEGGFDGKATYEMCSPIRGGGASESLDAYAAHYVQWMRANTCPPLGTYSGNQYCQGNDAKAGSDTEYKPQDIEASWLLNFQVGVWPQLAIVKAVRLLVRAFQLLGILLRVASDWSFHFDIVAV